MSLMFNLPWPIQPPQAKPVCDYAVSVTVMPVIPESRAKNMPCSETELVRGNPEHHGPSRTSCPGAKTYIIVGSVAIGESPALGGLLSGLSFLQGLRSLKSCSARGWVAPAQGAEQRVRYDDAAASSTLVPACTMFTCEYLHLLPAFAGSKFSHDGDSEDVHRLEFDTIVPPEMIPASRTNVGCQPIHQLEDTSRPGKGLATP